MSNRRLGWRRSLCWIGVLAVSVTARAEPDLRFYKQDSPPKYFAVGAAQLGLCGEIYAALHRRLVTQGIEVAVDPQLYPSSRILHLLQSTDNGVYCGAGRNAKREAQFHFSTIPVYSLYNQLVAHRDDRFDPQAFADLAEQGDAVGARFGASSTRFLNKQQDLRVVDQFENLQQGFELLSSQRRIRWFFYHDLGLIYALRESPLPLRLVPTRFRSYSHWMIYSKTIDAGLREALDLALFEMLREGELTAIEQRYKTLNQPVSARVDDP